MHLAYIGVVIVAVAVGRLTAPSLQPQLTDMTRQRDSVQAVNDLLDRSVFKVGATEINSRIWSSGCVWDDLEISIKPLSHEEFENPRKMTVFQRLGDSLYIYTLDLTKKREGK